MVHLDTVTEGEGEGDHHENHGDDGEDEGPEAGDLLVVHLWDGHC